MPVPKVANATFGHSTPGESVIGAGMAAIIQFTRGLAIEGTRDAIRANTITPSLV